MPDPLSRAIAAPFLAWDGRAHGPIHLLVAAIAQDAIFLAVAMIVAGAWLAASAHGRDRVVDAGLRLVPGVVAVAIAFGIAHVAGQLLPESRPFVLLGHAPLVPHAADASFPSDHVSAGMSLLAARTGRWTRLLTALVVVAVGAARMAAGIHWLIDIAGAAAIGLAVAWLVSTAWTSVVVPRVSAA